MTQPAKTFYTPEEYLALEDKAEHRSEYYQGQIYAMAGGSLNHSRIVDDLVGALNGALAARKRPCEAFSSDVRLQIKANGLFTYPDVLVICGEPQYATGRTDTVTNPVLIVEVLSNSTGTYDRDEKFELYKDLETLQNYVLISQKKAFVECFQRLDGRKWAIETYKGLSDNLFLAALELEIPLETIYRRVTLPTQPLPLRPLISAEDAESST